MHCYIPIPTTDSNTSTGMIWVTLNMPSAAEDCRANRRGIVMEFHIVWRVVTLLFGAYTSLLLPNGEGVHKVVSKCFEITEDLHYKFLYWHWQQVTGVTVIGASINTKCNLHASVAHNVYRRFSAMNLLREHRSAAAVWQLIVRPGMQNPNIFPWTYSPKHIPLTFSLPGQSPSPFYVV